MSTPPAGFNPASQPPAIGARRGGWSAAVAIALAFAAVYSLDRFTPPDLLLFPLYLLPIGLTLFNYGFAWATLACLLATLLGFQAELLAGRPFTHTWIPHQVWTVRGFQLLLITWLLSLYTRSKQIARHRLDTLKRLLPLCPDCGMLHCYDGQWRSVEAILSSSDSIGPLPQHSCQPTHPPAVPEAWR